MGTLATVFNKNVIVVESLFYVCISGQMKVYNISIDKKNI